MGTLLIRSGRVISPPENLDTKLDVLIEDGITQRVAPEIKVSAEDVLDASGCIVSPGFIDLHVHFREPGGEESETLETGLKAAVAGGFTGVCPMPNTNPVCDRPESVRVMIEEAGRLNLARIFPIAAASAGSRGEALSDFAALRAAGAVAFSDDGKPLKTAALMAEALSEACRLGTLVIDHCEELSLSAGGAMAAGETARCLGLKGIPSSAEDVCVARDLVLAAAAAAPVHLAHLSTAGAIGMVRAAKSAGVRVTCEVTPHHFTLAEDALAEGGTNAKMNPPLRSSQDRDAVRAGLADGTVDAIATDHAPHAPALKAQPLAAAPFGVIGLETALALAITQLVVPGLISLSRLVELMSCGPARIIKQPVPGLRAGQRADLTVFDPERAWTYRAEEGKSKSRNSPFDGWKLKGKVVATVVNGKVVYRD
jgi:dihydroorotase